MRTVMRSRSIGLVLTGILPLAALAAFLVPGDRSGWVLVVVCSLFPPALYLMAQRERSVLFPVLLAVVLLAGLGGILFLSGAGRPTAALTWMIMAAWLAPLALVGLHHAFGRSGRREEDH